MACVALLAGLSSALASGPSPEPEPAIDYAPLAFYPDRWRQLDIETRLHPWRGRTAIVLTPVADLDRGTMEIFLRRLDAGWEHYASLVGVRPAGGDLIDAGRILANLPADEPGARTVFSQPGS